MYNNPYFNSYNNNNFGQQGLSERIDSQIAQLNQMKEQIKNNQQPSINQTFQLAPTNSGIKYANTIEDVTKEEVIGETPFFSKDMSVVWIKNGKGNIKSYELNEIVVKDEKDIQIEYLQEQLNELRGKIENDANIKYVASKQNATDSTKYDTSIRNEFKKNKPTSIQQIPTSKKE